MDTELQQITSQEPVVENPLMGQSEAELAQAITQAQNKVLADATQPPAQGQAVTPTPSTTVQEGQVSTEQTTTQAPSNNQANQPVNNNPVETKPGTTFEQLQAKQGFKSPDALAESYVNLRRELERKSQELAQMRRQGIPVNPTQPVMPQPIQSEPVAAPAPVDVDTFFAKQVEQKGIVATIAELADIVAQQRLQPVMQNYGEIELRDTINKLSSSPDTAKTFTNPDVQAEMHRIVQEHPDRYLNNLAASMPEIHDLALGRLARKAAVTSGNPTVAQNATVNQAGFMEGKNKPVTSQPVDPKNMDVNQLGDLIRNIQRNI